MGFNKCILPSIDVLRDYLYDYGLEKTAKRYLSYDAYIGDSESIDFINTILEKYGNLGK